MTENTLIIAEGLVPLLTGSEAATTVVGLLLLILTGMAAITKGGDMFTDSSVDIAQMTRIPPAVVGATIVSTATSFPEFMVSLTGTLSGATEFAVGNAVGSCLCNIGLIIGVCCVTKGILVRKRGGTSGLAAERDMLQGPGMFMLGSCLLVCLFSLFAAGGARVGDQISDYGLSRWQALILFIGMFWYLAYSVKTARVARAASSTDSESITDQPAISTGKIIRTGLTFVFASGVVVLGSRILVCNGEALALRMGVDKLVLGLTLFAIGTSLPELAISLIAVLKGHQALGLGNIVGSNVMNICWVMASCALVRPLPIEFQTVVLDLPVTLLLTLMLLWFPWKSGRISTRAGTVMLLVYVAHLLFLTFNMS